MTREQKLALIVGFSLVLLVGVLISDHLSRARQARIASVNPAENAAPAEVTPPASDPLKPLEVALSNPPINVPLPAPSQAQPEPAAPTHTQAQSPKTIAQSPEPSTGEDSAIARAVRAQGGMLMQRNDGIVDIILPDTAAVAPATVPMPGTSDDTLRFATSPGAPPKNLGTNEQVKIHAVQKGETLFQIATKYYGSGHAWRQLAQFNGIPGKDGTVQMGTRLKIPAREALLGKPVETAGTAPPSPSAKPEAGRKKETPSVKPEIRLATYTVKKGETLGEISQKVLGTSKRWHELAELNKLDDEDSISAGTVLKLPPMRG